MKENPKLNASGYRDMTAYTAINNVIRERNQMKAEAQPMENNIKMTNQRIEQIDLSKCAQTNY